MLLALLAIQETTVQTIVRLPDLIPSEHAALRAITVVAPKATEDYIQRDMLGMTSGRPVRMELMPDHVRLSVTVDGDDVTPALSLTESILKRAILRQEDLDAVGEGKSGFWMAAIDPIVPLQPKLKREDISALYRRVFVPESMSLYFGGAGSAQKGEAEWQNRIANWQAPRVRQRFKLPETTTFYTTNPGSVSTVTVVGKVFPAKDPALPTMLFALIALGSGKGSALHRVWRERNSWSYRQEAVLWPVRSGWQPQLVAAMDPADADKALKSLVEDIKAWTEEDRTRALGMAEGVFINGVPFNPLYLSRNGPLGNGIADQTYLAGYWRWKTGTAWDPQRLIELMGMIKLEELKETSLEIVEGSELRVLPK